MSTITSFKDFNIAAPIKKFIGEKLKMKNIMGKPIKVNHFKIEDSKFIEKDQTVRKRLCLQFELDGKDHIVFTTGTALIETIKLVPSFPFTTIIIEKDEVFYFT